MLYCAIIGDIIDSKQINNRREVQNKLINMVEEINLKYVKSLSAKFMITLGDEFQGLINNREDVIPIINYIELFMSPIKIRLGIGIGEITTEINYKNCAQIDGPAFHKAREMINKIEINNNKNTEVTTNIMISSKKDNMLDDFINTIFSLIYVLSSNWTTSQVEIIKTYLDNDENQLKAAKTLNISQGSISKSLKRSHYYTYKSANNTLCKLLGEMKEY